MLGQMEFGSPTCGGGTSKSCGAELTHQVADFNSADIMAQNAISTLKLRYGTPACCHVVINPNGFSIELIPDPIFYKTPLIMSGWDDEAIQRT